MAYAGRSPSWQNLVGSGAFSRIRWRVKGAARARVAGVCSVLLLLLWVNGSIKSPTPTHHSTRAHTHAAVSATCAHPSPLPVSLFLCDKNTLPCGEATVRSKQGTSVRMRLLHRPRVHWIDLAVGRRLVPLDHQPRGEFRREEEEEEGGRPEFHHKLSLTSRRKKGSIGFYIRPTTILVILKNQLAFSSTSHSC